jgi:hypothetical protein
MLLPYTTLVYYGPGALAVESDDFESSDVDVRAAARVGVVDTEGGNQEPAFRVTKLRGWGVEIDGVGDVESFSPRLRARIGIDIDVAAQPTVFDIVQGVLNAQASQYNVSGTVGNKINSAGSGGVDTNALSAAVWGYMTRTLTSSGAAPSASEVADAVAGHSTTLTLGKFLALKD